MTPAERRFLTALQAVAWQLRWRCVDGLLRGYEQCQAFCPVTSLALLTDALHPRYDAHEWPRAATVCGYAPVALGGIVSAADNDAQTDPALQQALYAAVGVPWPQEER